MACGCNDEIGCLPPLVKDFLKLIVPFAWGVVCIAAMIAYGAVDHKGSASFAALSAIVSFILTYDIWMFHRQKSYGYLNAEQHRSTSVFMKFLFALFLAVCSLVVLIVSQVLRTKLQEFGASDAVWTASSLILSIVWAIDIGYYHMNWGNQTAELAHAQDDTEIRESEMTDNA